MLRFSIILFVYLTTINSFSQNPVQINYPSGKYNDAITIKITGDFEKIYYTLDGSIPDHHSKRWKDSLVVNEHFNFKVKANYKRCSNRYYN